jgi:hypothetical protein
LKLKELRFGLLCIDSEIRGRRNRGDQNQQQNPTKLTIYSFGRERERRGGA